MEKLEIGQWKMENTRTSKNTLIISEKSANLLTYLEAKKT